MVELVNLGLAELGSIPNYLMQSEVKLNLVVVVIHLSW